MSLVCPYHPRCRSTTCICVYGHTYDVVIIFQVMEIRLGFPSPRGSEFALFHYFVYWLLQHLVHSWYTAGTSVPAMIK